MAIFVNYEGPELAKEQKQTVRSHVMVLVRGRQKQARKAASDATCDPRPLAPATDKQNDNGSDHTNSPPDDTEHQQQQQQQQALATTTRGRRRAPNNNNQRGKTTKALLAHHTNNPNRHGQLPRLQPPTLLSPRQTTHPTGVPLPTFRHYLHQCASYSSYLDEAFVLVGFRQPSYFRPDLSKAACIYIGWLLTAGILDCVRGAVLPAPAAVGGKEEGLVVAYPGYEYLAVRELQRFVDGGVGARGVEEVVYPVVILGMFEMFRFSPRAITHLAAVERVVKARGGLHMMSGVMQNLVVMADTFQCLCLDTPLAFGDLGPAPTMRLMTADGFLSGNQLRSCPILLCDDEDFSLAAQYADPAIRLDLVHVLQAASDSFRQFFSLNTATEDELTAADLGLDAIADRLTAANDVSGLLLQTCALAARITRRTLSGIVDGFDDAGNELDVLAMYENTRFIGLKAWAGLPYVYVWVNLIGFAASTDPRMRSYFVVEVVRCAFSYGCYQIEVFQAVLKNFLHLRNAIAGRKMAPAGFVAGERPGLF